MPKKARQQQRERDRQARATISATTSAIIAMPTVRGSTSPATEPRHGEHDERRTASREPAAAIGVRGPARASCRSELPTAAIAEPTTIKSLMGHTGDREDALDAGELARASRRSTKSGHEPSTIATSKPTPSSENNACHALAAAGARCSSGVRNISTRMSRPCSTACASCRNTHADERQRHHLRDAGDRVVEQPCAP